MAKFLGDAISSICRGSGDVKLFEAFLQDFVDCARFLDYFKALWFPRLGAWTTVLKSTPLATAEVASSIESYHHLLKLRLLNEADESVYCRADWLVHKLGTKVHSYYWLDEYSGKDSFSRYWRSEWNIGPNPWCQGLQIPDSDAVIEGNCAKVVGQKNKEKSYVIWNPGSEFALCDCSWSRKGNLCKHAVKSTKVCRDRGLAPPSLALFRYYQALANLVHCPPSDTVIIDHAMAVAVSVRTQIDAAIGTTNGSSSNRPVFRDPQSASKPRESEAEETNTENCVCASQSKAASGDDEEVPIAQDSPACKKRKSGNAYGDNEDVSTYQDSLAHKKRKSGEAFNNNEDASTEEDCLAYERSKSGKGFADDDEVSTYQDSPDREKRKLGEASDVEGTSVTQTDGPNESSVKVRLAEGASGT
ncbi:unnamed protein product [Urochloa humidicola]